MLPLTETTLATAETGYDDADRGALRVFATIANANTERGLPVPTRVAEVLANPPDVDAGAAGPVAYVSEGRWIAACPFCPSAQLASRDDSAFLCSECWNAAVGGSFVQVAWPPADVVAAAEALLLDRPLDVQNWVPDAETVDALAVQNTAAGIVNN